jgi:hypothetical protein
MTARAPHPRYAILAAVLFVVAAGYDAWHLVTNRPFEGLALWLSRLAAMVNLAIWSITALFLVVRPASNRLMATGFGLSVVATILFFLHGLVLRGALGDVAGIPMILGAFVLAVLLKKAWTPFPWASKEPPAQPAKTVVQTHQGERPAI